MGLLVCESVTKYLPSNITILLQHLFPITVQHVKCCALWAFFSAGPGSDHSSWIWSKGFLRTHLYFQIEPSSPHYCIGTCRLSLAELFFTHLWDHMQLVLRIFNSCKVEIKALFFPSSSSRSSERESARLGRQKKIAKKVGNLMTWSPL